MRKNPLTAIDFYKTDHRRQYPEGTTEVYANFTPRSDKLAKLIYPDDRGVLFFGLQYFVQDYLIDSWNSGFFHRPKAQIVTEYKRRMDTSLGPNAIDCAHIAALHDLGYLPLRIKALPEGTRVPAGIPVLTVVNTHPDFFWLTNYIETILSCYLWKPVTSATTAFEFRRLLEDFARETGTDPSFVPFQAHDFSFRGMSSWQDAAISGAAHMTAFCGTDTVTAIDLLEDYYAADPAHGLIGGSVPATEHSVMCMGLEDGEIATFRRLIAETYPAGIVSIVSDTWDFWRVVTEYVRDLKDIILGRDGKLVIRPDSGDPVKIVCGDPDAPADSPARKGAIACLWEVFGGTTTSTGHRLLDPHIGLIYGDSISLERAKAILEGLDQLGFASGNIVFGVGSYTYQYVTRDNFGFAVKATSGVVNGQRRDIFKDPKTDSGTKKSARGLLRVVQENGRLVLHDRQTEEQERGGLLEPVFENGQILRQQTLAEIRQRVAAALPK